MDENRFKFCCQQKCQNLQSIQSHCFFSLLFYTNAMIEFPIYPIRKYRLIRYVCIFFKRIFYICASFDLHGPIFNSLKAGHIRYVCLYVWIVCWWSKNGAICECVCVAIWHAYIEHISTDLYTQNRKRVKKMWKMGWENGNPNGTGQKKKLDSICEWSRK